MLAPYKSVFDENTPPDSALAAKALLLCGEFAMQHPNSYITPLALIRFDQLSDDPNKTEILYNAMLPGVKASSMGVYIGQKITEAKKNAGESVSGNMDSFSSFVQKKTDQIRKQYGCATVEYSVELESGQVRLKAKAKV